MTVTFKIEENGKDIYVSLEGSLHSTLDEIRKQYPNNKLKIESAIRH